MSWCGSLRTRLIRAVQWSEGGKAGEQLPMHSDVCDTPIVSTALDIPNITAEQHCCLGDAICVFVRDAYHQS